MKSNTPCEFDLDRRKRGPRPRPKQTNTISDSAARSAVDQSWTLTSGGDDDQSSHSPNGQGGSPPAEPSVSPDAMNLWKDRLSEMFGAETYHLSDNLLVSVDQVLHLILIFCVTVNRQQCPIMSPAAFFRQLESGQATRQLCHAMCAASAPYSRHVSCKKLLLRHRLAEDAREGLASLGLTDKRSKYEQLLTLSVLSLYESSQGNGLQAWYDLTTATSVLCALRYSVPATEDDPIMSQLDTIHNYLQIALVCHSIGNQTRPTLVELTGTQLPGDDDVLTTGRLFSPRVLLDVSNLMQQCIDFSQKDLNRMVPAPWSRNSSFAALKRRLDTVHAMYVGDSALSDPETLELLQGQEGGEGNYVLCVSMLHSARIMLEAVFIPVTVQDATPYDAQATPHVDNPIKSRRTVDFPAAPRSFCCERLASCLRSARVLTSLCRSLMQNCDFTMPSFLGYSLYLAGLVFLNQLRSESEKKRLEATVEELKTIFSFLNAMRPFFAPAQTWVKTLLEVHALEPVTDLELLTMDTPILFSSFMARFNRVAIQPYCPASPDRLSSVNQSVFRAIGPTQLLGSGIELAAVDDPSFASLFDMFQGEENRAPLLLGSTTSTAHDLVKGYTEAIQEMIESCATED